MNKELLKRIQSFLWRGGMMVLAFAFAWVASNVGLLELDVTTTTIIGLVFGEISKAIKNWNDANLSLP
jgi:hypothetical protein